MKKSNDARTKPPGMPQGFITVPRAATIARCSQTTIRRLIQKRRVEVVRWRYRVLVQQKSLQNWMKVRPYEPEKPDPVWAHEKRRASARSASSSAEEART